MCKSFSLIATVRAFRIGGGNSAGAADHGARQKLFPRGAGVGVYALDDAAILSAHARPCQEEICSTLSVLLEGPEGEWSSHGTSRSRELGSIPSRAFSFATEQYPSQTRKDKSIKYNFRRN